MNATDARVAGSGVEVAGALAYRVQPGYFLGGESVMPGPMMA